MVADLLDYELIPKIPEHTENARTAGYGGSLVTTK